MLQVNAIHNFIFFFKRDYNIQCILKFFAITSDKRNADKIQD